MARFMRNNQPLSQRHMLMSRYNSARSNLLLVAGFTAINLIMLVAKTFTYFLFSASIPYAIVDLAMYFCGMYPAEYYGEDYASAVFLPGGIFYIALAVAVVIIALYVLCYLFSKKQKIGWLICALVMFVLDTAGMFWYYGLTVDILVDIIFHVWIIVILSLGIAAHFKLKKLPEESEVLPPMEEAAEQTDEQADAPIIDSVPLRDADTEAKAKIFVQTQLFAHEVIYRRVERTNELVIDGKVYDEYVALLEKVHILTANLDGHAFAAGYDGTYSYITVDGQTAVQKIRVI